MGGRIVLTSTKFRAVYVFAGLRETVALDSESFGARSEPGRQIARNAGAGCRGHSLVEAANHLTGNPSLRPRAKQNPALAANLLGVGLPPPNLRDYETARESVGCRITATRPT